MKKTIKAFRRVSVVMCLVLVLMTMMPTAFAAGSLLKIGSSGSAVTALQNRLLTLGYMDYSPATGYFGAVTKTAVARFQGYNGLASDGIAGPATNAALNSSSAKRLMLSMGSRGEAVSTLQARLRDLGYTTSGNVTGYYGAVTKSAVAAFQGKNGLGADGIAGPATRAKLFSDNAVRKSSAPSAAQASRIADIALTQQGKPYVLGGNGPSSYDCSGLAYYAMTNAGYSVSRLSASAYSENSAWTKVTGTSSLQKGDLVFFHSDTSSYISHMGIYIGNGQFVHASSGQGKVMVSSFSSYWLGVYSFARRVA
jgi:peptidoglycan hydrolase-like protein with peptidoglycan-binding domain